MGLVSAIARVPDYLLAVAHTCNCPQRGDQVQLASTPGSIMLWFTYVYVRQLSILPTKELTKPKTAQLC